MENKYFYYLELKNLQFNGKVKCKILLINHCEKFNVQFKAGLLNVNLLQNNDVLEMLYIFIYYFHS